jgi:hypothetical protein
LWPINNQYLSEYQGECGQEGAQSGAHFERSTLYFPTRLQQQYARNEKAAADCHSHDRPTEILRFCGMSVPAASPDVQAAEDNTERLVSSYQSCPRGLQERQDAEENQALSQSRMRIDRCPTVRAFQGMLLRIGDLKPARTAAAL